METQNPVISTWQVISWWEWRRLAFNGLLLLIGIAAIVGFEFLMDKSIPPGEDAAEPGEILPGVIVYAFMANVCYTLGWIVELGQRQTDLLLARVRGKRNFRLGVLFSGILTTGPFWYALVFFLFHSIHHSR